MDRPALTSHLSLDNGASSHTVAARDCDGAQAAILLRGNGIRLDVAPARSGWRRPILGSGGDIVRRHQRPVSIGEADFVRSPMTKMMAVMTAQDPSSPRGERSGS